MPRRPRVFIEGGIYHVHSWFAPVFRAAFDDLDQAIASQRASGVRRIKNSKSWALAPIGTHTAPIIYLLGRAGTSELRPGDTIQLAEARNLIAAQCGTAPEVLSRTFRRLEEDGVLSAQPDHITVLLPDRLRALAEWIEG